MARSSRQLRITVSGEEAGQRLDVLLAAKPPVGSRSAAQRLLAAGLVTVDGRARSKNFRVSTGQVIEAELPAAPAPALEPEAIPLDIKYEDDYLLVVDKPAGIVTHPAPGHRDGTLVHALLGRGIAGGSESQRPGIVHRLDRDTSGLLIVARDEEAHRRLVRMMSAHAVKRTYLALVHGVFETASGTIEAPLGRDARERQKMAVAPLKGRAAVTHFHVLESWAPPGGPPAEGYSLLEVRLETGRTHQIRVHLAAIGHPVVGDRVYGRGRDTQAQALGVGRQFLHSARLSFLHPVTGARIEVQSPLPADLQAALDRLRGGNAQA